MKSIKIISVSGTNSTIEFTLDNDTKVTQVISGVPINDADAAKSFLSDYAGAYETGLEQIKAEAASVTPASGLVGVSFSPDGE